MALGMNAEELKTFFEDEYVATSKRREGEKQAFAQDLKSRGVPEIEANLEAMRHIQHEATIQALLLAIVENNARIDSQLNKRLK